MCVHVCVCVHAHACACVCVCVWCVCVCVCVSMCVWSSGIFVYRTLFLLSLIIVHACTRNKSCLLVLLANGYGFIVNVKLSASCELLRDCFCH